jgi:putative ABC transport system permease protein
MIRTNDGADIKKIARTINYSLENSPIKAYTMNGMFQNISDKMADLQVYSNIMLVLLILVSMIALICIFTITINERKYEFGVLASLGAKKSHIINIIIENKNTSIVNI